MASEHVGDVFRDRRVGLEWEQRFRELAEAVGRGRIQRTEDIGEIKALKDHGAWPLPDVTIGAPRVEHHEIKHKTTTPRGEYGLEAYRLDAMLRLAELRREPVLYTIHDWGRVARSSTEAMPNRLRDWRTADIEQLAREPHRSSDTTTYCNSNPARRMTHYWLAEHWRPLAGLWGVEILVDELPVEMLLPGATPDTSCHVCGGERGPMFQLATLRRTGPHRGYAMFRYCQDHVGEYRAAAAAGAPPELVA